MYTWGHIWRCQLLCLLSRVELVKLRSCNNININNNKHLPTDHAQVRFLEHIQLCQKRCHTWRSCCKNARVRDTCSILVRSHYGLWTASSYVHAKKVHSKEVSRTLRFNSTLYNCGRCLGYLQPHNLRGWNVPIFVLGFSLVFSHRDLYYQGQLNIFWIKIY